MSDTSEESRQLRRRKAKQAPIDFVPSPHLLPELAAARGPNIPHVFHHDFEIFSPVDLPSHGTYVYATDPRTEIIVLAFQVDNEPVQIWTPEEDGGPFPEWIEAATNPLWQSVAHGDWFEYLIAKHILEKRHGFPPIPLERRQCSMAMACAMALPAALEKATAALGLPKLKDKAGAALMRKMAKPQEDGSRINDPVSRERLFVYVRKDLEAESGLHHVLPPLSADEQAIWRLNVVINARGFCVDNTLLESAYQIVTRAEATLLAEFRKFTGLESTDQRDKLIAWLAAHDCAVNSLQKRTLKHALRRKELEPSVRRVIELRLKLANAAADKVTALRAWRGADGRVRGAFRYHGAAPGRWTSIGIQVQNFKRDSAGLDAKIAAVMNGDVDIESAVGTVGDIARAFICAAPGHRLLIGDFSGIESRVLAYLSGQQSKLEQWQRFDASGALEDDPYYILGCTTICPKRSPALPARSAIWRLATWVGLVPGRILRRPTTPRTKKPSSAISAPGGKRIRTRSTSGMTSIAQRSPLSDAPNWSSLSAASA
jgi:DNA polymerase